MGDPAKPSSPAAASPAKAASRAKSPASPVAAQSPARSPASPIAVSSPVQAAPPLVVDEHPGEDAYDLGIDLDSASDVFSLQSSVLKYREENGRTYHAYKDGSYVLPNDEDENERLDLQHALLLLTFDNRLQVAPLGKQPHRVLDAGCGTGLWAIEFADEHPDSQVTGIDLSPIQPAYVPSNLQFFIDDIEDDWTFSKPFDFIFARFMTGSVQDWPRFFKQSYDNLNPGGVIEVQDILFPMFSDDGSLTEDSALKRWSDLLNEGFRGNGRPMDTGWEYERQLAEAGFVDVGAVREKWPTNRWPRDKKYKQIGIWNLENLLTGLGALSLAIFTRPKDENGLDWSKEEVEVLLAGVRRDLRDTNIHAYWRVDAVYARKPETAD